MTEATPAPLAFPEPLARAWQSFASEDEAAPNPFATFFLLGQVLRFTGIVAAADLWQRERPVRPELHGLLLEALRRSSEAAWLRFARECLKANDFFCPVLARLVEPVGDDTAGVGGPAARTAWDVLHGVLDYRNRFLHGQRTEPDEAFRCTRALRLVVGDMLGGLAAWKLVGRDSDGRGWLLNGLDPVETTPVDGLEREHVALLAPGGSAGTPNMLDLWPLMVLDSRSGSPSVEYGAARRVGQGELYSFHQRAAAACTLFGHRTRRTASSLEVGIEPFELWKAFSRMVTRSTLLAGGHAGQDTADYDEMQVAALSVFGGRSAEVGEVLDKVRELRSGSLLLLGPAGSGKTSLLLRLRSMVGGGGGPVPGATSWVWHFCTPTMDRRHPIVMLRSLLGQIEALHPHLAQGGTAGLGQRDLEARLRDLLSRVSEANRQQDARLVIVIDGLDESPALLDVLPSKVPDCVLLLVSARSRADGEPAVTLRVPAGGFVRVPRGGLGPLSPGDAREVLISAWRRGGLGEPDAAEVTLLAAAVGGDPENVGLVARRIARGDPVDQRSVSAVLGDEHLRLWESLPALVEAAAARALPPGHADPGRHVGRLLLGILAVLRTGADEERLATVLGVTAPFLLELLGRLSPFLWIENDRFALRGERLRRFVLSRFRPTEVAGDGSPGGIPSLHRCALAMYCGLAEDAIGADGHGIPVERVAGDGAREVPYHLYRIGRFTGRPTRLWALSRDLSFARRVFLGLREPDALMDAISLARRAAGEVRDATRLLEFHVLGARIATDILKSVEALPGLLESEPELAAGLPSMLCLQLRPRLRLLVAWRLATSGAPGAQVDGHLEMAASEFGDAAGGQPPVAGETALIARLVTGLGDRSGARRILAAIPDSPYRRAAAARMPGIASVPPDREAPPGEVDLQRRWVAAIRRTSDPGLAALAAPREVARAMRSAGLAGWLTLAANVAHERLLRGDEAGCIGGWLSALLDMQLAIQVREVAGPRLWHAMFRAFDACGLRDERDEYRDRLDALAPGLGGLPRPEMRPAGDWEDQVVSLGAAREAIGAEPEAGAIVEDLRRVSDPHRRFLAACSVLAASEQWPAGVAWRHRFGAEVAAAAAAVARAGGQSPSRPLCEALRVATGGAVDLGAGQPDARPEERGVLRRLDALAAARAHDPGQCFHLAGEAGGERGGDAASMAAMCAVIERERDPEALIAMDRLLLEHLPFGPRLGSAFGIYRMGIVVAILAVLAFAAVLLRFWRCGQEAAGADVAVLGAALGGGVLDVLRWRRFGLTERQARGRSVVKARLGEVVASLSVGAVVLVENGRLAADPAAAGWFLLAWLALLLLGNHLPKYLFLRRAFPAGVLEPEGLFQGGRET